MRILFASTRGAGHLAPLVPLARACVTEGHEVLVTGPQELAGPVAAAGLAFRAVDDPPQDELGAVWSRVPALSPDEANRAVVGEIFGRLNATATLPGHRAACREWGADVVVRESSEFGSALAAELEGLPHARVGTGLAVAEEMALGTVAPVLDELRVAVGLAPDPDASALRRSPYLSWFPAGLEDPAVPPPPATMRLRDPAWDAPAAPVPDWWPDAEPGAPLVYATFGSVAGAFDRMIPVFGMAMEALASLPVRGLLTVGRDVDLDALPAAPPNVRVERWVPQAEVLPHAALAVCHGGAGSTVGALATGRPLVAVPLFADQPLNAARVAASGAGLAVAPDARAVRAAVERVLAEPAYAAAAAGLAAELRAHDAPQAAVEMLAAVRG